MARRLLVSLMFFFGGLASGKWSPRRARVSLRGYPVCSETTEQCIHRYIAFLTPLRMTMMEIRFTTLDPGIIVGAARQELRISDVETCEMLSCITYLGVVNHDFHAA
jgi:hypothetical protein